MTITPQAFLPFIDEALNYETMTHKKVPQRLPKVLETLGPGILE